jgi:hypothetical protein
MSCRTGKLRYKVVNIKGVLGAEPVVIMQSEIKRLDTTVLGWAYEWVNTEPEWLMLEPSHNTEREWDVSDPLKVL